MLLNIITRIKQQFNELIDKRSKRKKHKNQTYYFFDDMINIKNFHSTLLKIDKKSHEDIIFTILVTSRLKSLVIVKIFTALIPCI